ncbi:MAG: FHA domain-containing protein [Ardenticatenaceae bacterium]|nr:FHA domain-containing protein [Ardenticatenaceae bacterium]
MSTNQKRFDLRIDIFERKAQWAKPLPTLKPAELVEAILQEFQEVEYLSKSATDYYLAQVEDETAVLQEDVSLQEQLPNESRLQLREVERPLPKGTSRPSQAIYVRELVSGKVYKLNWLPAIIGRPDKNQPNDDWIAVDLESYKTGLRVSRRHAQITEQNGRYFIESLSRNPTLLKDAEGNVETVGDEKRPLQHGDTIQLERSNIALKFIVRSPENV